MIEINKNTGLASRQLLPIAVFIFGVLLSSLGSAWLYNNIKKNAEADFKRTAERVAGEITRRFTQPVYGLNGARGAYAITPDLSRSQFSAYVASRDLPNEFPGVRGFGFIQRVEPQNLEAFINHVRADGAPQFTLRQLQNKNEKDLYIIKYIQPTVNNKGAEGLDIGSESVRREGIMRAIDHGEATLSGTISLVQDSRKTPGILLFVPVYATDKKVSTTAERRAALIGVVYSPLVIEDLLNSIPEFLSQRVDIELFDTTTQLTYDKLIFDADSSKTPESKITPEHSEASISTRTFHHIAPLMLPGRMMTLRVSSTPLFESSLNHYSPWMLFAFGLLLSTSLALLIRQQTTQRYRAEMIALNMTADLERLALVARKTSNMVVITDINRKIIWINEGFERFTGYSQQEVMGKSPGRLLQSANTDQQTVQALRTALNNGESFKGEILNRDKAGQEYWIELEIQPRYDNNQELIGFMAIESDITERKETNLKLAAALRDNVALLSTLNVYGIILVTDNKGSIIEANDAFCRISGYSHQELIGQNPRIVDSGVHPAEFWKTLWQTITSGKAWRGEICNRSRSGKTYWVDTTIAPFQGHDNLIEKFVVIQFDITEAKNLQANLAIARNQLVRAADVAELGIWSWDIEENSLVFDDRMNQIYAIPETECQETTSLYEHWHSLLHPDDVMIVDSQLQAAIKSQDAFRQIFRIVITGQTHVIESAGMVERDENGRAVLMMGINRDITQQRQNEAILKAAKQSADDANQAKSAFLANMSHELRTPMNAIMGMLTLLRKTGLNAKQADYALKSEAAARTLLRLLNDILDFSKIEAGKMELDTHPFEINQILRDLSVILSSNMKLKPVEMLFDIDPELPKYLSGDSMRLQQVLINLASNALKFTEQGEVVLFIHVLKLEQQQVTLHIGVRDTGIGIAKEHQERIFSGFTQAESSITRRFGGTGLGLVISQRLVSLMGGKLELNSEIGKGSTFHFSLTLPLDLEPETSTAPLAALHVLVVDDNPTACELIKRMGESFGWSIDIALSGTEALHLLQEQQVNNHTYNAVFIDWHMPDLDGLETSKEIRKLISSELAPVIVMVTAYDREMLLQLSEEEQSLLDGFLVKPVTASMLFDAITDATIQRYPEQVTLPHRITSQQLTEIQILVVEDNLNNQQIARELLEDEGAKVTLANNGQDAITHLQQMPIPFDIVLMDLQMPIMDGLTATKYIRETMGITELPIVAMTANAMDTDRDACLAAGMNSHIGKPFDVQDLIETVRKYTDKAGTTSPPTQKPRPAPSVSEERKIAQIVAQEAGIELDAALHRLGDDLSLYQHMSSLFISDLTDFPTQLNALIEQQDLPSASRLLHTIKGLAAQLGTVSLANEAGIWEKKLIATPAPTADELTIFVHHLNQEASTSRIKLSTLLEALANKQTLPDVIEHPANELSFRQCLDNLVQLLHQSDMAALDAMTTLKNHFGAAVDMPLHSLEEAINQLDFAQAIIQAQELQQQLDSDGHIK